MKMLTRSNEILMLAILRLGEEAHGLNIVDEVVRRSGKKMKMGSLWVSLDILCEKGLVSKSVAESTPQRGGRGKIYYQVTTEGEAALEAVRELSNSLWEGIPVLGSGRGEIK